MIITKSSLFDEDQIKAFEEAKDAKYIFETCIKDKHGSWANDLFAIFYQETPHPRGSNYFALYYDYATHKLMIADGISATEPFTGAVAKNGDIIFSRYRHDMRSSPDKSVIIDGGRDYVKLSLVDNYEPKLVRLQVIKDKLEIMNEGE